MIHNLVLFGLGLMGLGAATRHAAKKEQQRLARMPRDFLTLTIQTPSGTIRGRGPWNPDGPLPTWAENMAKRADAEAAGLRAAAPATAPPVGTHTPEQILAKPDPPAWRRELSDEEIGAAVRPTTKRRGEVAN